MSFLIIYKFFWLLQEGRWRPANDERGQIIKNATRSTKSVGRFVGVRLLTSRFIKWRYQHGLHVII